MTDEMVCCMDVCVGVCWNVWFFRCWLSSFADVGAGCCVVIANAVVEPGRNELFGLAGRGGIVVVMAQVPLFLVSFAV